MDHLTFDAPSRDARAGARREQRNLRLHGCAAGSAQRWLIIGQTLFKSPL